MTGFLYKIMARLVAICLLILAISVQSSGQKTTDAVVYCRDGSVYRGELVEEKDNAIRLAIANGDTLYLAKSEIKKIKRSGDYIIYPNGRMHDIKGFFWSIKLGFSPTSVFTFEERGSEHFELLFGWRFNKRWTVGNGIGSEFNVSQVGGFSVETTFTSMFLYGRYYFTDNRARLFAYSRLGFGSGQMGGPEADNTNISNNGGIQWQGGGGVHFASKRNSRFIISLGYYLQKASGTQSFLDGFGNEVNVDFDILITRPILKFGIEFR